MNKEELENHLQAIEAAMSELMTQTERLTYYLKRMELTLSNIQKYLKAITSKK